jgi:ATP-binding cassette subfamily F protein uup
LDRGNLYAYAGTYADFCEAKAARLANQEAQLQSNLSKYRLEYQWMKRQPQGRQTKAKFRIDAFAQLQKAIQLTSKISTSNPQLSPLGGGSTGTAARRLGNTILQCKGVSLSFPIPNTDNHIGSSSLTTTTTSITASQQRQQLQRCIVQDFTYDFNSGDRIGIVGRNGVGKSTFLKILTGRQPIDSGEIIKGETVVFGIYDQLGLQDFDDNQRLLDYVKERVIASDGSSVMAETPQEARKLLQKWEFPRNRWNER